MEDGASLDIILDYFDIVGGVGAVEEYYGVDLGSGVYEVVGDTVVGDWGDDCEIKGLVFDAGIEVGGVVDAHSVEALWDQMGQRESEFFFVFHLQLVCL